MKRLLFLLTAAGFFACSSDSGNVAGGPGSETTNGIVASVQGVGAPYATVALRRMDYRAPTAEPENAIIVADSYADSTGRIDLKIPEDGSYRLTVVHNGSAYSKVVEAGDFKGGDTLNLVATAVVNGSVDVPEGAGFVWVGVLGTDLLVKADASGKFVLPALPANDSLQLYFVSENYETDLGTKPVYVKPMESLVKDFRVPVEPPIEDIDTGVVALLNDGSPAAFATVALRNADAVVTDSVVNNGTVVSDIHADEKGRFLVKWPTQKGTYRLTVTTAGFAYSAEYEVSQLASIDTVRLNPTTVFSSKVTLISGEDFAWVGVRGLDIFVKTDPTGFYVLPNLPVGDSLDVYFVRNSSKKIFAQSSFDISVEGALYESPSLVLQDFENGGKEWYVSQDTLKSVFKTKSVNDGIVFDKDLNSNVFHGEYALAKDDYAWVLVGEQFSETLNLTAIDSVSFWAKGDGEIRLAMESWMGVDAKSIKAASSWRKLEAQWKKYTFRPAELCVNQLNVSSCSTSWEALKGGVKQIHIFPQGGTEFYIDDVTLYGALF